jgi:hypothetical protein
MAIPLYLAMTAAEFSSCNCLPAHTAWMSCRFSPGGKSLSNLPSSLPPGTLLILDDQTPPSGHDTVLVRQQLSEIIDANRCSGLLLDFQRSHSEETAEIVKGLLSLPCPVCVSHLYAKELSCPVFMPPCPLTVPLSEHLAPWDGREIWLEVATDSTAITVTGSGSRISYHPCAGDFPYRDAILHCRYRIETASDAALFLLRRTFADLPPLLQEAEKLGVTRTVGLWQELTP